LRAVISLPKGIVFIPFSVFETQPDEILKSISLYFNIDTWHLALRMWRYIGITVRNYFEYKMIYAVMFLAYFTYFIRKDRFMVYHVHVSVAH
jgi:hypothetical protein